MKFNVSWKVIEVVNGEGDHDDGVKDGDTKVLAEGEVKGKEADSANALRTDLTAALEQAFPSFAHGPTYDMLRSYDILITGSVS